MNFRMDLRRTLLYLIAIFAALTALIWFYHFMTTGKLVINTNSKYNVITITDASPDSSKSSGNKVIVSKRGTALTVNLKYGKYIASVDGGSIGSSQLVTVKARSTKSYTLNTTPATGVETVAAVGAQNIAADANRLIYVNPNDQSLNQIDAQNTVQTIPNSSFQSVKWADASFGVGQDSTGQLYQIINGVPTLLDYPLITPGGFPAYTVSPSHEIYWTSGKDIYKGTSGHWKKFYTSKDATFTIAAGTSDLTVIVSGDADSGIDPSVTVVNSSGKAVTRKVNTLAVAWSQNDKYLVYDNQSGGEVLDNQLNHVATIPHKGFENPVWLDDNTLFYTINDEIWSYDIGSQRSTLVANTPFSALILEMTLSTDRSYLYLLVSNPDGTSAIQRVGLHSQQVPDFIYQLQSVMPETVDNYTLEFFNFNNNPPTIIVDANPGTDPQAELQVAKEQVQSQGFDLSKIQFQVRESSD